MISLIHFRLWLGGGGLPPPCRLWKLESGSLFCLHPSVLWLGSPCVTMVTGTGSAW